MKNETPKPKSERSQNEISEYLSHDTIKTYNLDKYGTNFKERSVQESAWVSDSFKKPFNPDPLYQRYGNYDIYDEMLRDDQIAVCMKLKKDMILNSGWEIIGTNDDQEDIIEDLEIALYEDLEEGFDDAIEQMLSAFEYGFSLTEKVFGKRSDGSITLTGLKTRHPGTFIIDTDYQGHIKYIEQQGFQGPNLRLDPNTLIHFVNNPKFQNPYGTSDLYAAYTAWFIKKEITKYLAIFIEKAASPIPVAKYDKNAPADAVDAIFNAIKKFQTKTALAIPKEIEVEFLETSNSGDAFHKAIDQFNMFIGRALMIPDLMGFQGSATGGGSLALGKEQMDLFFKHIERRRASVERLINQHIICPLVASNWGLMEYYPTFKFKKIREDNKIEAARVWIEAVKSGIFKANDNEVNYLRSLVSFPEGDVEEGASQDPLAGLFGPTAPGQPSQEQPAPEVPENESPEEQPTEDMPAEDSAPEDSSSDQELESLNLNELNLEDVQKVDKKEAYAFRGPIYKYPPGNYYKKVNFAQIKTQMDSTEQTIVREMEPVIKKIRDDIAQQIEKKGILKNQNAARANDIKVKYLAEVKQILKRNFIENYKQSKIQASNEILKANFQTILPSEKFLEVLEAESFGYIGDWAYNIEQKTRIQLIKAIKDGLPLSVALQNIDDTVFADATVSVERFSRTKTTEVLNRARNEFFEESGVVAAYQYSAIIDGVTSDICRGLDGKIFKIGTQPQPPMHFNCRSLLIPITKFEDFKVTESIDGMAPDEFIKENIGTGFSKQ